MAPCCSSRSIARNAARSTSTAIPERSARCTRRRSTEGSSSIGSRRSRRSRNPMCCCFTGGAASLPAAQPRTCGPETLGVASWGVEHVAGDYASDARKVYHSSAVRPRSRSGVHAPRARHENRVLRATPELSGSRPRARSTGARQPAPLRNRARAEVRDPRASRATNGTSNVSRSSVPRHSVRSTRPLMSTSVTSPGRPVARRRVPSPGPGRERRGHAQHAALAERVRRGARSQAHRGPAADRHLVGAIGPRHAVGPGHIEAVDVGRPRAARRGSRITQSPVHSASCWPRTWNGSARRVRAPQPCSAPT